MGCFLGNKRGQFAEWIVPASHRYRWVQVEGNRLFNEAPPEFDSIDTPTLRSEAEATLSSSSDDVAPVPVTLSPEAGVSKDAPALGEPVDQGDEESPAPKGVTGSGARKRKRRTKKRDT